jgi:transposase
MEACATSHYWSRQFTALGHQVKLIAPQFVKPFVKSNKNDYNDAEAITEAGSRPTMRFVPPKSIEQQDIQSVHRVRSRVMRNRTALANQIRGLLGEYGLVCALQIATLRRFIPEALEDGQNELTDQTRELLAELYEELVGLDQQIKHYDKKIRVMNKSDERCQRIHEIEGVGDLTASAMVAAVGDAKVFKSGRQMSAWLGLVPSQHSTGGKTKLGRISKRGDTYLRTLLIHGARSVVGAAKRKTDARSRWVNALVARRGFNVACVAVANKNARIIWALLSRKDDYRRAP